MTVEDILFAYIMGAAFFAMLFYIFFGQITVRKLRKNPETKHALGVEFASGWDVLNVAGALAMPRWLNRKLRSTPLAGLYADADLLDKFTNRFDRVLATIFYTLFMFSGFAIIALAVLDTLGVFS